MPKKRYTPEQIVTKLRQVDAALARGQSIARSVKAIGVTETTFAMSYLIERSSTACERLRS